MQMTLKHDSRRPARRLATVWSLAVVMGVGLATLPVAPASAAVSAFAYQTFDCRTPGTDFGVALGTPAEPTGPVTDSGLKAEAMKAGGVAVQPLKLREQEYGGVPRRWASAPVGLDFDYVTFTWSQDGQTITKNSPKVKPEMCDGPAIKSASTQRPGPGLVSVAPVRLLDTRVGTRSGTNPVAAGNTVRVKVNGANGVPGSATAAMLNVTAANPSAPGFLTVYPCGVSVPKTSSVNFVAAETRAGSAFTKVGSSGEVCVFASAATDVVVDLNGYVADSTNPVAFTPIRVVDTRPGASTDVAGTPKGKQTNMTVPLDKFGVADATNLIVNITTVGADAPGHITLIGCRQIDPPLPESRASVVNYAPGRAQANLAIAQPYNGELCLTASAPTHIIVDLVGATSGSTPLLGGGDYRARLLDTRPEAITDDGDYATGRRLKANVPLKLKVRDRLSAVGATSVALNVTAVQQAGYGHITVYPCGSAVPVVSNLNYVPRTAIANLAFSKLDAQGYVCIVSHVDTDLVVDLAAVNSTKVQTTEFRYPNYRPGIWSWSTLGYMGIEDSGTYRPQLYGGTPPYTLTGPTVSGLTVSLTPSGMLTIAIPDDVYLVAKPTFTVVDAAGTSQQLELNVGFDPQFGLGTGPNP